MPAPQDLTIQRSTDLDFDVAELWALVSTADGWVSWLVDDADINVTSDSTGTATVDENERAVRIDSVIPGRRVNFSWWDPRDRSTLSFVQLDVIELPDGRSRLNVSEHLHASTGNSASMSLATAIRWEVAMVSLWMLALHSLVMA